MCSFRKVTLVLNYILYFKNNLGEYEEIGILADQWYW